MHDTSFSIWQKQKPLGFKWKNHKNISFVYLPIYQRHSTYLNYSHTDEYQQCESVFLSLRKGALLSTGAPGVC